MHNTVPYCSIQKYQTEFCWSRLIHPKSQINYHTFLGKPCTQFIKTLCRRKCEKNASMYVQYWSKGLQYYMGITCSVHAPYMQINGNACNITPK